MSKYRVNRRFSDHEIVASFEYSICFRLSFRGLQRVTIERRRNASPSRICGDREQ
jgi:hypothetical protein